VGLVVAVSAALPLDHEAGGVIVGCSECGASVRLGHNCPSCYQLALDVPELPAERVRFDPDQLVLPGMAPAPSTIRGCPNLSEVI
jgi:hypothetical protein